MVTDELDDRDETIDRIAAALRPLPEVNPAARARLLVAVAAERARTRDRHVPRVGGGERARWRRWAGAIAGLAAAAAFATFISHRGGGAGAAASQRATSARGDGTPPVAGALAAVRAGTLTAAGDARALQRVQLVLRAGDAHHVSVVGDFTEWDPRRAPMTRDPASGLWSITLALAPGRHVYAFLVDDSLWVRDPRAPEAADADFGRPGSVLLVGGGRP